MTAQLIPVHFHDDTVFLVERNGEPYTPVRPFCDALGLNWAAQTIKLNQRFKTTVSLIETVASDGKKREMLCLPLRKLPAYLYSIDPEKVKPAIRAKVELYQGECDEVLWRHWSGQMAPKPATAPVPVPPAPETVTLTKDEYIGFLKMQIEHLQTAVRPKHRGLSDEDKSRIKALRVQGLGEAAIGKRIGRPKGTVGSYLRRVRLGAEG